MTIPTTAVLVGRFQPYTSAHQAMVNRALEDHEYVVVMVAGANALRTKRNPWTWTERVDMIVSAHPYDERRLMVTALNDNDTDEQWAKSIAGLARAASPPGNELVLVNAREGIPEIDGFGREEYEWPHNAKEYRPYLHSEEIRKLYFNIGGSFETQVENDVPITTLSRMQQFIDGRLLESIRSQGDSWV